MSRTSATVVADSISGGTRLTTLVCVFPRFILAELNTHRAFSRNSASSRAVPVARLIEQVEADPFVPAVFGAAKAGMQAGEELPADGQQEARARWLDASRSAAEAARSLAATGAHKQWANRVLEPFLWHSAVISSTDFSHFLRLRDHADAQPEMRALAVAIRAALDASTPAEVERGWHVPWGGVDLTSAVARCARVSYLRHDAETTPEADRALYSRLAESGHWSPFEHVACAMGALGERATSNFAAPWVQLRVLEERSRVL